MRPEYDEHDALLRRPRETPEDLPLFAAPPIDPRTLVRPTDPPPSHTAAARVAEGVAAAQERAILRALLHVGPMTANEIDTACAWDRGTTGKRTGRLVELEYIEVVGEGVSHKGNPCGVYGLTEAGSHQALSQINERAAA